MTGFRLRGDITNVEVIAVNRGIRDLEAIVEAHGKGRWRKLKGQGLVELPTGKVVWAELHWYEAHGLGRHDMKVKRVIG